MIFWINVPIGIGAIVAALILLPGNVQARTGLGQLDLPGALTAVTGLAGLVFGIQTAASDGWASPKTLGALTISVFCSPPSSSSSGGCGGHWCRRTLGGSIHWSPRTGVMLGVTGLLVGAVFLGSIFFQTTLGYSALEAGLAFLPLAVILTVGTRLGSHLLGRVAPRLVAAGGCCWPRVGRSGCRPHRSMPDSWLICCPACC